MPNYNQMVQIGNNSDFWSLGIYIGGSNALCTYNDPLFVNASSGYGWGFLPLFVGRQAPCTSYASKTDYDLPTSASYGSGDGTYAENRAIYLGFTRGSVIYLDVEGFDPADSSCRNAMKAYVQGFVKQLHNDGWKTGVYGSSCSSYASDWITISPPPDQVFLAEYYNAPVSVANTNVFNRSCVNNLNWGNNQRHHQYFTTQLSKKYGSYTLPNRDETCSQGWVAGNGYNDGVLNTCP